MTQFFRSLATAARWHRRGLAAIALAIAVMAALSVMKPPPPEGIEVVVATVPIEAGTTITEAHLAIKSLPRSAIPEDALGSLELASGRLAVANLSPGTVLTSGFVVSARPKSSQDRVLVPLRLADSGVSSLLRVGDVISVVGHDSEGRSVIVAKQVRVAALTATSQDQGPLSTGVSTASVVVVECDPAVGASLAVTSSAGQLSVMWG